MAKHTLKDGPRTGVDPYKLTAARLKRIKEALRLGASFKLTAHYAGVSEDTFRRWRNEAATAKAGTLMARLHEALMVESAKGGIINLRRVDSAGGEGDVRAAMWILERRHGYTKTVEVKGIPDREVEALVGEMLAAARDVLPADLYGALLDRWAALVGDWSGEELGVTP